MGELYFYRTRSQDTVETSNIKDFNTFTMDRANKLDQHFSKVTNLK